eukprot:185657-Pleurochrysis_carterae.AAC.1
MSIAPAGCLDAAVCHVAVSSSCAPQRTGCRPPPGTLCRRFLDWTSTKPSTFPSFTSHPSHSGQIQAAAESTSNGTVMKQGEAERRVRLLDLKARAKKVTPRSSLPGIICCACSSFGKPRTSFSCCARANVISVQLTKRCFT